VYASLKKHHITASRALSEVGVVSGAIMVACWLGLLLLEAVRWGQWIPNIHSYPQAVVLAGVFASYAIGWRYSLVGAVMALTGTAMFFVLNYVDLGVFPPVSAMWLATPGVLYFLAWWYSDRRPHVN
jgi:hypothetical protein